ncbi:metallophosphoesterase [Paenibacillus sp. DCT19]|uniref:metallophosphoesterase family protein n=1 Tax=Paenibacillus sp. DCT19 TaxID=2211212 RepID=UPI000FE1E7D8|nr:metallophosphoesterase [Paenibacillus sp. DCT19]
MKTIIQFDLISDIHLDFWVEYSSNHKKQNQRLDKFVQIILPEEPSEVLAIAGDLGHYNKQNFIFLEKLREHYKYILLVAGNHDYYLVTKSIKNKYKRNSIHRFEEMKIMAEKIPGVLFLDGNTIEIGGTTFGGAGMWYDFQYGIYQLNIEVNKIYDNWKSISNDSVLIEGLPRLVEAMYVQELTKLKKILDTSDVVVTHISPDWTKVPLDKINDISNSFYYFNGRELLYNLNRKIWCFGHIHRREDYINEGCRLINASLGYPDENDGIPKKIMKVTH